MKVAQVIAALDEFCGFSSSEIESLYSDMFEDQEPPLTGEARKMLLRLALSPSDFYDIPYTLAEELQGRIQDALGALDPLLSGPHGLLKWTIEARGGAPSADELEGLLHLLRGLRRNNLTETVVAGADDRIAEILAALRVRQQATAPSEVELPSAEMLRVLASLFHKIFFLVGRFIVLQYEVESAEVPQAATADALAILQRTMELLKDDDGNPAALTPEETDPIAARIAALQAFLDIVRSRVPMFGSLLSPDAHLRAPAHLTQRSVLLDVDAFLPQDHFENQLIEASGDNHAIDRVDDVQPLFLGQTVEAEVMSPFALRSWDVSGESYPSNLQYTTVYEPGSLPPANPASVTLLVNSGTPNIANVYQSPAGDTTWTNSGQQVYTPYSRALLLRGTVNQEVQALTEATHYRVVFATGEKYWPASDVVFPSARAGDIGTAVVGIVNPDLVLPDPIRIEAIKVSMSDRLRVSASAVPAYRWAGRDVTVRYSSGQEWRARITETVTISSSIVDLKLNVSIPTIGATVQVVVHDPMFCDGLQTRIVSSERKFRAGDSLVFGGQLYRVERELHPILELDRFYGVTRTPLVPSLGGYGQLSGASLTHPAGVYGSLTLGSHVHAYLLDTEGDVDSGTVVGFEGTKLLVEMHDDPVVPAVYSEIFVTSRPTPPATYQLLKDDGTPLILDRYRDELGEAYGYAAGVPAHKVQLGMELETEAGSYPLQELTDHHVHLPVVLPRKSPAVLRVSAGFEPHVGEIDAPVFLDPFEMTVWGYPGSWIYDLDSRQVMSTTTVTSDLNPYGVVTQSPLRREYAGPWSFDGPTPYGPFGRALYYLGGGEAYQYEDLLRSIDRAKVNLGDSTLATVTATLYTDGPFILHAPRDPSGMDVVYGGILLRDAERFPIRIASALPLEDPGQWEVVFTGVLPETAPVMSVELRDTWIAKAYRPLTAYRRALTELSSLMRTLHPPQLRWYSYLTRSAADRGETVQADRFAEYRLSDILTTPPRKVELDLLDERLRGVMESLKP